MTFVGKFQRLLACGNDAASVRLQHAGSLRQLVLSARNHCQIARLALQHRASSMWLSPSPSQTQLEVQARVSSQPGWRACPLQSTYCPCPTPYQHSWYSHCSRSVPGLLACPPRHVLPESRSALPGRGFTVERAPGGRDGRGNEISAGAHRAAPATHISHQHTITFHCQSAQPCPLESRLPQPESWLLSRGKSFRIHSARRGRVRGGSGSLPDGEHGQGRERDELEDRHGAALEKLVNF